MWLGSGGGSDDDGREVNGRFNEYVPESVRVFTLVSSQQCKFWITQGFPTSDDRRKNLGTGFLLPFPLLSPTLPRLARLSVQRGCRTKVVVYRQLRIPLDPPILGMGFLVSSVQESGGLHYQIKSSPLDLRTRRRITVLWTDRRGHKVRRSVFLKTGEEGEGNNKKEKKGKKDEKEQEEIKRGGS